jgi:hypothetical protein
MTQIHFFQVSSGLTVVSSSVKLTSIPTVVDNQRDIPAEFRKDLRMIDQSKECTAL